MQIGFSLARDPQASLYFVQDKLTAERPGGIDLVSAPVAMLKGQTAITLIGTHARRDGLIEIECESFADALAKTPEGGKC